jgi:hypothetical protein
MSIPSVNTNCFGADGVAKVAGFDTRLPPSRPIIHSTGRVVHGLPLCLFVNASVV